MIEIRDKKDCCGCSACAQSCPCGAIAMRRDFKGFEYPAVDSAKCNGCGKCETVCPIWTTAFERKPTHVFAVKHKDVPTRIASASGGAFTLLASATLNRGGVVYGAAFDADWNVLHVRIDAANELIRLRGSKYAQSSLASIFPQVKGDLRSGLPVLFSGLPCQIAALYRYLGRFEGELRTVELVCGGIGSHEVWKDFVAEECRRLKIAPKDIIALNFRDKSEGWIRFSFAIEYYDLQKKTRKDVSLSYWKDCRNPYMRLYLHGHIIRPSCFNCRFKNGKSGADYAIADFWQIDSRHPEFFEDNGVSLLMQYCRADLRQELPDGEFLESTLADAVYGNASIVRSVHKSDHDGIFYILHKLLGLSCRRGASWSDRYKACKIFFRGIANGLKRGVKRLARKVLGGARWKKSAS